MKSSDGGKGSSPRPFSVDKQTFDSNWDAIFGSRKISVDSSEVDSEVDKITRYNAETQEAKRLSR